MYRGLANRYGGVQKKIAANLSIKEAKQFLSKEIINRADYELDVIHSMKFNGYFLIIWDFINWAKNQGIVSGRKRQRGWFDNRLRSEYYRIRPHKI